MNSLCPALCYRWLVLSLSLLALGCEGQSQRPPTTAPLIAEELYMASDEAERLRRYLQALQAEAVTLAPAPSDDAADDREDLHLKITNSYKLRDRMSVPYATAANRLFLAVHRALVFPEDYRYLHLRFVDETRPEADTSLQLPLDHHLPAGFEWQE